LLRVCAEIVEDQNDQRVEIRHLSRALERFEMDHQKALFGGLAEMQMNLLYTMAVLSEIEDVITPSTSRAYQSLKGS